MSIVVGAAAAKVLRFLVAAIEAGELPASHVIGDALGMTSQNVDYHIAQLERKGYLARARAGKSRTIRVLLRDPVTTA